MGARLYEWRTAKHGELIRMEHGNSKASSTLPLEPPQDKMSKKYNCFFMYAYEVPKSLGY